MTMELPEEKLIAEVKARPPLYDKESAAYAQMDKRLTLWEEVAEAVGGDVDTCRKRWRSLRDAFIKNYRAVKNFPNGSTYKKKKMWTYFDSMFFLVPFVEQDEKVKDVATKYIETAEQNSCASNDATEEPESQNPIVIESIFSVSPEENSANVSETSQGYSELEDSSGDEVNCNLGDHDYVEALNKRKRPDEAYKKFLQSLEHDKNTELSVENFINEVQARPLLYAKGLTDNRKHSKRLALWKEVADATSLDVISCRKRWRSLRDVFNKNYRALVDCPADKKKKIWPYFEKMFFLAPHLEEKETFQYAATKYSCLWQNDKQDPNPSDDNSNTLPLESGDSIENVKGLSKEEGTPITPKVRFFDAAKSFVSRKYERHSELSENKLIAEIKARPQLFTRGTGGSSQQNKRLKLWKEVAAAVGEDVAACKKRWKSLRDVFIKNYRATKRLPSLATQSKKRMWLHYKKMVFLIPYLEQRYAVNDETTDPNQPACEDTYEELNSNSQMVNTNGFTAPLDNTDETLPLPEDALKHSESQTQHNNSSKSLSLVSLKQAANSFSHPNDSHERIKSEIELHKLRTCLVSLERLPINFSALSGSSLKKTEFQEKLDSSRTFSNSLNNITDTAVTLTEATAGQPDLRTDNDNINSFSARVENISTIVLETVRSQPVNSPASEALNKYSRANENRSNSGSARSKKPRGPYKRSLKRKLYDVNEEKLMRILSHEDDPDKHFLLSLLPSLKRMNAWQNAQARIRLQQVLFEIEFSDMNRNVQYHPESFAQLTYTPPSPSSSFYA